MPESSFPQFPDVHTFEALTEANCEQFKRGARLWAERLALSPHPEVAAAVADASDHERAKPGFIPLSPFIGDHLPVEQQIQGAALIAEGFIAGLAVVELPIDEDEQEALRIAVKNFAVWTLAHGLAGIEARRRRLEVCEKKAP